MSTTILLTTPQLIVLGALAVTLGTIIGYALGLADFDRVTRNVRREGPRA